MFGIIINPFVAAIHSKIVLIKVSCTYFKKLSFEKQSEETVLPQPKIFFP